MSQADINAVLSQIRNIQAQSQLPSPALKSNTMGLDNAVMRQQHMQELVNDKAYLSGYANDRKLESALAPSDVKAVKGPENITEVPSFGMMFKQAVDTVNSVQKHSGYMTKQYELGNPNIELSQVMVATQKAGVAFSAMAEVRNKLVDAYKDIMNMPI